MNFSEKEKQFPRGLDVMSREAWKLVWRIWLYCFLERILMFELQSTFFSISRMLQPPGPWYSRLNRQMTLSVVLSFVTLTKAIIDHVNQGLIFHKSFKQAKAPEEAKGFPKEMFTPFIKDANSYWWVYQWVRIAKALYWIGILVVTFFWLHGSAKIVMAFYCEHSIWDYPTSALGLSPEGCVLGLDGLAPDS